MCVCVCVCVQESEREGGREMWTLPDRESESQRKCSSLLLSPAGSHSHQHPLTAGRMLPLCLSLASTLHPSECRSVSASSQDDCMCQNVPPTQIRGFALKLLSLFQVQFRRSETRQDVLLPLSAPAGRRVLSLQHM